MTWTLTGLTFRIDAEWYRPRFELFITVPCRRTAHEIEIKRLADLEQKVPKLTMRRIFCYRSNASLGSILIDLYNQSVEEHSCRRYVVEPLGSAPTYCIASGTCDILSVQPRSPDRGCLVQYFSLRAAVWHSLG